MARCLLRGFRGPAGTAGRSPAARHRRAAPCRCRHGSGAGALDEALIEAAVMHLLGAGPEPPSEAVAAVLDPHVPLARFTTQRRYRPFLPVPLWGEVLERPTAALPDDEDDGEAVDTAAEATDSRRCKASHRDSDQVRRNDPLMLNRFEKILGLADMANLSRNTDDDDAESARKAAEDMDEIALSRHS